MAKEFADKRELLDRERKRDRLADDLLEDAVDDADSEEDTVEELGKGGSGGAPAATGESGDESVTSPRIASRTAIELREWGEPTGEKMEEVEREAARAELEEGIDDPVRMYQIGRAHV